MNKLLLKLMLIAALLQFGMTLSDLEACRTRQCVHRLEIYMREVLEIEWKPISVFPEEAKRFR